MPAKRKTAKVPATEYPNMAQTKYAQTEIEDGVSPKSGANPSGITTPIQPPTNEEQSSIIPNFLEGLNERLIMVEIKIVTDTNNAAMNSAVKSSSKLPNTIQTTIISLSNVPSQESPPASGVAPAREADKQETCQKSRRDGDLLDRSVRIYGSSRFIQSTISVFKLSGTLLHRVVEKSRKSLTVEMICLNQSK